MVLEDCEDTTAKCLYIPDFKSFSSTDAENKTKGQISQNDALSMSNTNCSLDEMKDYCKFYIHAILSALHSSLSSSKYVQSIICHRGSFMITKYRPLWTGSAVVIGDCLERGVSRVAAGDKCGGEVEAQCLKTPAASHEIITSISQYAVSKKRRGCLLSEILIVGIYIGHR